MKHQLNNKILKQKFNLIFGLEGDIYYSIIKLKKLSEF
jgi:hypothetical protein